VAQFDSAGGERHSRDSAAAAAAAAAPFQADKRLLSTSRSWSQGRSQSRSLSRVREFERKQEIIIIFIVFAAELGGTGEQSWPLPSSASVKVEPRLLSMKSLRVCGRAAHFGLELEPKSWNCCWRNNSVGRSHMIECEGLKKFSPAGLFSWPVPKQRDGERQRWTHLEGSRGGDEPAPGEEQLVLCNKHDADDKARSARLAEEGGAQVDEENVVHLPVGAGECRPS